MPRRTRAGGQGPGRRAGPARSAPTPGFLEDLIPPGVAVLRPRRRVVLGPGRGRRLHRRPLPAPGTIGDAGAARPCSITRSAGLGHRRPAQASWPPSPYRPASDDDRPSPSLHAGRASPWGFWSVRPVGGCLPAGGAGERPGAAAVGRRAGSSGPGRRRRRRGSPAWWRWSGATGRAARGKVPVRSSAGFCGSATGWSGAAPGAWCGAVTAGSPCGATTSSRWAPRRPTSTTCRWRPARTSPPGPPRWWQYGWPVGPRRERLYVDRRRGLLLRRELLDARGAPYRSVAFRPSPPPLRRCPPPWPAPTFPATGTRRGPPRQRPLEAQEPDRHGYRLVGALRDQRGHPPLLQRRAPRPVRLRAAGAPRAPRRTGRRGAGPGGGNVRSHGTGLVRLGGGNGGLGERRGGLRRRHRRPLEWTSPPPSGTAALGAAGAAARGWRRRWCRSSGGGGACGGDGVSGAVPAREPPQTP